MLFSNIERIFRIISLYISFLSGDYKCLYFTHGIQLLRKIMNPLTIVANIHAAADKVELVKAELIKLIAITRAEAGCIKTTKTQPTLCSTRIGSRVSCGKRT